jgi:hypothetical protein
MVMMTMVETRRRMKRTRGMKRGNPRKRRKMT